MDRSAGAAPSGEVAKGVGAVRGLGAQDEWTAKGPPYRARGIVASGTASGGQLELTYINREGPSIHPGATE